MFAGHRRVVISAVKPSSSIRARADTFHLTGVVALVITIKLLSTLEHHML